MQVDEGAIKFIINGADCMSPGLVHPHGEMADVKKGDIVVCFSMKECRFYLIFTYSFDMSLIFDLGHICLRQTACHGYW